VEQKTPAGGLSLGRTIRTAERGHASAPAITPQAVAAARQIAENTVAVLPTSFDRVLPRGYSLVGQALLMARFETVNLRGQALYARHPAWGEREAAVFLRDLKEGWLDEVASFMRWQLRTDPVANAIFQHAMVHLKANTFQQLVVV